MKRSTFSFVLWIVVFTLGSVLGFSPDVPNSFSGGCLIQNGGGVRPTDRRTLSLDVNQISEAALVAGLDGTIYLVEVDSLKPIWAFSSGPEIYSSYQAPAHNLSGIGSNYYIDCGEDWKLYAHDSHGKVKLIPSLEEYISSTPQIVEDGGIVLGSKTTSAFLIDTRTGRIIHKYSMPDSPTAMGHGDDNLLYNGSLREKYHFESDLKSNQLPLYVTRTDYRLTSYMPNSDKVLWNLSVSEIGSAYLCQDTELSIDGNLLDSELTELDIPYKMPLSCQSKTEVFRFRNHTVPEFLSLLNGLPNAHYADKSLPAFASDVLLPKPNSSNKLLNACDSQDLGVVLPVNDLDQNHWIPYTQDVKKISVYSFQIFHRKINKSRIIPFLVILLALAAYRYNVVSRVKARWIIQNSGMCDINVNSKRKKHRKSVKAGGSNGKQDNENEVKYTQGGSGRNFWEAFNQPILGNTSGRTIGKLVVFDTQIGKGSNGTIVLEGFHEGRSVAVKRLVRDFHDIAVKEIQNLIVSDRHPNIVRWYGVEQDQYFIYLALERCTCCLNDLIRMHINSSGNPIVGLNLDVEDELEDGVHFSSVEDLKKEYKLWRPDGYPTSLMLKLMRDIIAGIVHLHELGIIHRDLKPQNVLIVRDTFLRAKISDMGISKRLVGDMSSLSNHATGGGSSGWQAPEQLLHGRQTRAVDMFSLGCVLFFCITGGRHPFGNSLERDVNIVRGKVDLFLVEHIPEAVDLFLQLLDLDSENRPKASEVLHHPLLWNAELRLSFLRDTSDRVELEDREVNSDIFKALECIAPLALGSKWNEKMESIFLNDIGRYRRYRYDSVRDLLRVLRNKLSHFRELPTEIQDLIGPVPEGFDRYFFSRFPKLLIEVYKVMIRFCSHEEWFCKYLTCSE